MLEGSGRSDTVHGAQISQAAAVRRQARPARCGLRRNGDGRRPAMREMRTTHALARLHTLSQTCPVANKSRNTKKSARRTASFLQPRSQPTTSPTALPRHQTLLPCVGTETCPRTSPSLRIRLKRSRMPNLNERPINVGVGCSKWAFRGDVRSLFA